MSPTKIDNFDYCGVYYQNMSVEYGEYDYTTRNPQPIEKILSIIKKRRIIVYATIFMKSPICPTDPPD